MRIANLQIILLFLFVAALVDNAAMAQESLPETVERLVREVEGLKKEIKTLSVAPDKVQDAGMVTVYFIEPIDQEKEGCKWSFKDINFATKKVNRGVGIVAIDGLSKAESIPYRIVATMDDCEKDWLPEHPSMGGAAIAPGPRPLYVTCEGSGAAKLIARASYRIEHIRTAPRGCKVFIVSDFEQPSGIFPK